MSRAAQRSSSSRAAPSASRERRVNGPVPFCPEVTVTRRIGCPAAAYLAKSGLTVVSSPAMCEHRQDAGRTGRERHAGDG